MPLPLKDMTVKEKLAAMEELWEDLSRTPEAVVSPAWHKKVLDERSRQIAEGRARYVSWEKAKKEIRKKVS
jgi:hypothetical protein